MGVFIFTFSSGFLGGIALRSLFDTFSFAPLSFLLGTILLLYAFFLWKNKTASRIPTVFAIFLISFGLGSIRANSALQFSDPFGDYIGERVSVSGVVVRDPEEKETTTQVVILPNTFSGTKLQEPRPKLFFRVPVFEKFSYGDEVKVEGTLKRPFEGEGRFNYPMFLAKDGIFYEIANPEVNLISQGKGNPVLQLLFPLKHTFVDHIKRALPEPHASLSAGILLGIKGPLGKELTEQLRSVSVIHIVALSGYNVTIIAVSVIGILLLFLSRTVALSLGAVSIILFVLFVGAGATVVRASAMALIALLGQFFHRKSDITRALFVTVFFMALNNPLIVLFDPSFELSFLATLGLILLSPAISQHLSFVSSRFGIREIAAATLSTQLFVLPLLLFEGGSVSLVSLPANLLILPTIPFIMLLSFFLGVFGFLGFLAFSLFAFPLSLLLSYVLFVVKVFAAFPVLNATLSPIGLVIAYLFLAVFVFFFTKNSRREGGKGTISLS
ncbi:MAG: ComEC/Rec2 family competence protein [Patescibacteria group bacterium]